MSIHHIYDALLTLLLSHVTESRSRFTRQSHPWPHFARGVAPTAYAWLHRGPSPSAAAIDIIKSPKARLPDTCPPQERRPPQQLRSQQRHAPRLVCCRRSARVLCCWARSIRESFVAGLRESSSESSLAQILVKSGGFGYGVLLFARAA